MISKAELSTSVKNWIIRHYSTMNFHSFVEMLSWLFLVILLTYGGIARKPLSLVIFLSGISYKVSKTVSSTKFERKIHQMKSECQQELTNLQADMFRISKNYDVVIQAEKHLFNSVKSWEDSYKNLEKQYKNLQKQYENLDILKVKQFHKYQVALNDIQKLNVYISELENHLRDLEATQRVHHERMNEQQRMYTDQLQSRDRNIFDLKNELDRVKHDYKLKKQEFSDSLIELEKALAQITGENQLLQTQLKELSAPKRVSETSWFNNFGNTVADWINEVAPIHLEKVTEESGLVTLQIKPVNRNSIRVIQGMLEEMQLQFELLREPTLKLESGSIYLYLCTEKNAKTPADRILQPKPNWLEKSMIQVKEGVKKTNHARFVGESESGKSSLVCNCIGLVNQEIPNLEIRLADPLFETGESDWTIPATYKNDVDCVRGLEELESELEARKQGKSKEISILFIQDEIDTLAIDYGDRVTNILKKIWKQGRHYNIYLWIIGQTPLVRPLSLGASDINNAVCFYLSTTISRGLADAFLPANKDIFWMNQYHQRLANGEEFIVFVRPKRELPFMANPPVPRTYNTGLEPEFSSVATTDGNQDRNLDLDKLRQNLESLFQAGSEVSEPNSEMSTEDKIRHLKTKGLTVSQIVYELWKLKPSRSKEYKDKVNFVNNTLKS